MRQNERSPWSLLTTAQDKLLDEAIKHPARAGVPTAEMYRAVGVEFAIRSAHLLVSNDLRGAIDHAEIARVAHVIADTHERQTAQMRERIALQEEQLKNNPDGYLVTIPGQKKLRRMKPGEPVPEGATIGPQPAKAYGNQGMRGSRKQVTSGNSERLPRLA